jgi:hypothetical protein
MVEPVGQGIPTHDDEYGMGDFIQDLKDKGYITEEPVSGSIRITPKTEQGIRKKSLEEIFEAEEDQAGRSPHLKPGQETRSIPNRVHSSLRHDRADRLYHFHPECADQSWHR